MRLTSAESSRCATFLSRRSNAVLSKAFFWYPSITRTVPSPSFFANSVLSKVLSVPICSPCSFASAFFCSSVPAQSASPAMPPATSSSASRPTSVFVVCFMARSPALAGLPDHQPGEEQPEGEQVEGEEGHRALLLGGEEQVVALALLWPDGDARLFLGYPGHRVQGEVLVSGE